MSSYFPSGRYYSIEPLNCGLLQLVVVDPNQEYKSLTGLYKTLEECEDNVPTEYRERFKKEIKTYQRYLKIKVIKNNINLKQTTWMV